MEDPNFDTLVDPTRWTTFDAHIARIDAELGQDLRVQAEEDAALSKDVRDLLGKEFGIRTISAGQRKAAEDLLFQTRVCAVDGTYSPFPMLSGLRCRIGVAAITYRDKRTEAVLYVSEQQLRCPENDPLALLSQRKPKSQVLTPMVGRAIMLYKERAVALEREEEWALVNGPLVPYELRTGLGKLRALPTCLDIAARFVEKRKVVGVLASTTHLELASVGLALRPGEYVRLGDLQGDLSEYLEEAKFSAADDSRMRDFVTAYAPQMIRGLFRAGARAYLFETHDEFFDEAAAIVLADASFQRMRGYPLLLDYADAICSHMLSASDFQRQVQFKLAKLGTLGYEAPEEQLRRR